jgi:putative transposase
VGLINDWSDRVGVRKACLAFGVPDRTWRYYNQKQRGEVRVRPSRRRVGPRKPHPGALTKAEEDEVVGLLCSERFCDVGVTEAWITLLDEGVYLCSVSTMHRILRKRGLNGERRQAAGREPKPKPRVVATAPNMVWCWDISRVPGPARGYWFYLYTIYDLWSRYAVGWTVAKSETAEKAEVLINTAVARQKIDRHELIIHSDRGTQMTSATLSDLYENLGIRRSLSRPRTSNDNPHAEAGFKTLKYKSDWPDRFDTLDELKDHCEQFFNWYNYQHHHSGIGLLTPADRHQGNGHLINLQRQTTLNQAYKNHPERFPKGQPEPPYQPQQVWINPPTKHTNTKPN